MTTDNMHMAVCRLLIGVQQMNLTFFTVNNRRILSILIFGHKTCTEILAYFLSDDDLNFGVTL
jgi:hypothetical protein